MTLSADDVLPAGYNPDFDMDLSFGHEGELYAYECIRELASGKVEVKRERYANGRVFVETGQNPRGTGWKPSGIRTTKADYWAYVKPGGIILFIPTDAIQSRVDEKFALGLLPMVIKPFSTNPARGFLIEVRDLLESGCD